MTNPTPGCDWPIDTACFDESWANLDSDIQARSITLASNTLRRLTGYRVGGCPITVRPCKRSGCFPGMASWAYGYMADAYGHFAGYWPHINEAGFWVNSCGCGGDCSDTVLCEIALPEPVGAVTQVKVNGSVVNPTFYRVDRNRLVWVDSSTCAWPAVQDMGKPDTAADTFSVTYLNSYPVDSLGAYAAGVLAMEFAKACTGGKCRLPTGVTTVARQGVSYDITKGSFPDGFTGIREVDGYIALWNPQGRRQATTVWSPDLRRTRVV